MVQPVVSRRAGHGASDHVAAGIWRARPGGTHQVPQRSRAEIKVILAAAQGRSYLAQHGPRCCVAHVWGPYM